MLDPARIRSTGRAVDAVATGVHRGLPPAEMVRLAARRNFDSVRADPYVPLWLALWAKHGEDDRVRALLHDHYAAVTTRLLPAYEAILGASGRAPRPPFTTESIAVAVTALNQGLALRIAVDPDAVPGDLPAPPAAGAQGEDPWDLFGALAMTLLHGMTEEVPGPDGGGEGPS